MAQKTRPSRVAALIQKHLASIIQFELRDPRVSDFVVVSAVDISDDLSLAKIYLVRVGGYPEDIDVFLRPFIHATPFFRKRLSQEVKLRITPQLQFVYDTSLEYGDQLSQLIDKVTSEDENQS